MYHPFRRIRYSHFSRSLVLSLFRLPGILLVLLAVGERAYGQNVLYQTGFESPTFTAGASVDGQGGFAVTTGAPSAITISTVQPHTGAQDLLFTGSALTDSGGGFFVGTAGVAPNFDATGSKISMNAEVMLTGPSTATGVGTTGDLVSINMEAILGDGSYFSTYLSSDGNAYGFSTNYDANALVTLNTYHDLNLLLDFSNRLATYSVDGTAFGTVAFNPSVTSNVLSSAQFTMYAIDPPADHTAYTARVDDFTVQATPEPSSLLPCLIGAGVAAFTLRRRRK